MRPHQTDGILLVWQFCLAEGARCNWWLEVLDMIDKQMVLLRLPEYICEGVFVYKYVVYLQDPYPIL